MKIEAVRYGYYSDRTIGKLFLDDVFFSYTLEDKVRPDGIKIYGETAIPEGVYPITMEPFRGDTDKIYPHLHNVPNFTGVCLHGGNKPEDTMGCILVGYQTDDNIIWDSAIKDLCQRIASSPAPWKITVHNGG